jgi:hypothetical protein
MAHTDTKPYYLTQKPKNLVSHKGKKMFKDNDCKDNQSGCYCLSGVPEVAKTPNWYVYLMLVLILASCILGIIYLN